MDRNGYSGQKSNGYEGSPGQEQYENEGEGYYDGGDSVTKKLVGSRASRKRAEEDVKLLANRIALLKMEEQKAWKKIEETKKKAKEIMNVKQRNTEQIKLKEQRKQEKEIEEKMLAERNQNQKNNIKENIQMSKQQHQMKLLTEAERLKIEKREQQEMLMMQKEQEQLKNASIKQMIKSQQQGADEKKRIEMAEKKAKARAELQQKIIAENQRRLQIEAEVAQMEQDELELIKKLQNTQFIQKSAYEDLENALNGNVSPDSQMKQSQMSGGQGYEREFSPVKNMGSEQKGGKQYSGNKFVAVK